MPAGVAGTGRAGAGGSRLVATTGRRTRTSGRRGGRRARPRPGPDRLTRRVNSHSRGPGRRRSPSSGWNRVRVRPWSRSVTGRRRRACARAGTGGRTVEPDEQGRGAGGREGEPPVAPATTWIGPVAGMVKMTGETRVTRGTESRTTCSSRARPATSRPARTASTTRSRHGVATPRAQTSAAAAAVAARARPCSRGRTRRRARPGGCRPARPPGAGAGPGRRRPASTRASPASRVLRARLVPARDGVDEAERVQWRRHEAGGVVRAAAASVAWGRT